VLLVLRVYRVFKAHKELSARRAYKGLKVSKDHKDQ
jgi:hypothetical protein